MKKVKNRIIVIFLIGIWVGALHHYIVSQDDRNHKIMDDKKKHLFLKTRYEYEEDVIKKGKEAVEIISTDFRTANYYMAESLIYHLLMANKYGKYDYCVYFYSYLMPSTDEGCYNEDNLRLSLEYLNYGAKNHSRGCINKLWEIYSTGIGVRKDSLKADSLEKELELLNNKL